MTTLTDDQVAILRKALEHIVAHPKEWDQRYWGVRWATTATACGTSFCLAGHVAVTVAGARPAWELSRDGDVTLTRVDVDLPGGATVRRFVPDYAYELLGLDLDVALSGSSLFSSTNSLRRLAELCYLYSGGRVDLLAALPPPTERDLEAEEEDYQTQLSRYDFHVRQREHARWRGDDAPPPPPLAAFLEARVGPGRRVASC